MDYTDFMWLKLLFFIAAAFVWGFWRELTGRPLRRERPDTEPEEDR